MKWLARRDVGSARSSHAEGEWDRWFVWYPVVIATSKISAQWVWLEFVERKWSAGIYGTGRKKTALSTAQEGSSPAIAQLIRIDSGT
jgi:hypothetical protein